MAEPAPLSLPPFPHRWYEDFAVGLAFEYGEVAVTEEKILAFAREYDPEPFHTDRERAKASFGGLIASGVQTAAWWRRMNYDAFPAAGEEAGSGLSPGWEEIRWPSPVRAGDVLRVRTEVVGARPLRSRPGMGLVRFAHRVLNQDGELRQEHVSLLFVKKRPSS
jgi:acyl dehydratase